MERNELEDATEDYRDVTFDWFMGKWAMDNAAVAVAEVADSIRVGLQRWSTGRWNGR